MEYKKMREYTHEEFVNLVLNLNETELIDLSAKKRGISCFVQNVS